MSYRLIACVVFFLMLLLNGCGQSAGPPEANAQPPAVTVVPVEERAVSEVFEDVGRTEAIARVDVRAQVTGVLQSRAFTEGSDVSEGELLYEIDPAQYEADFAVAVAAVANARAAHDRASRYLERLKGLRSGAVSAVDMDTAIGDEAETRADLQQAEAQLKIEELDLGYTKISSPISGRAGESSIDVGNLITAENETLTTIVQLDPIYVTWAISARLMTAVTAERIAAEDARPLSELVVPRLRLSNGTQYPHKGEVVFVDNEVDAQTGTVTIRARFPNPDALLIPGQFVTTLIQRSGSERHRLIPQAAVQQDQSGRFVLVVKPDKTVEQRQVTLGARIGTEWIVSDGLEVGEQVIYQGLEKVQPGVTVAPSVRDATGSSDAATAAPSASPSATPDTDDSEPRND